MNAAWCCKCQNDASLARAVAELPCPKCGSVSYFIVSEDGQRDSLLNESERMMRLGRWSEAERALEECRSLMSDADFNLSSVTLSWRRECAASALDALVAGSVPLDMFHACMVSEFDEYVVDWMLREFRGIRLVPDGGSYLVEVCHGEQET